MLLLMMNAENQDRFDYIKQLLARREGDNDMRIDRCAISCHLLRRREVA